MIKDIWSAAWRVRGKIAMAMGIVGAVAAMRELFGLSLDGVPAAIIDAYKRAMAPVYELAKSLPFTLSDFTIDVLILYTGLVIIAWRIAKPFAQIKAMFSSEVAKINQLRAENPDQPQTITYYSRTTKGESVPYDWLSTEKDFDNHVRFGRAMLASMLLLPIVALPILVGLYFSIKSELTHMVMMRYNAVAMPDYKFADVDILRSHIRSGFVEAIGVPLGVALFFVYG